MKNPGYVVALVDWNSALRASRDHNTEDVSDTDERASRIQIIENDRARQALTLAERNIATLMQAPVFALALGLHQSYRRILVDIRLYGGFRTGGSLTMHGIGVQELRKELETRPRHYPGRPSITFNPARRGLNTGDRLLWDQAGNWTDADFDLHFTHTLSKKGVVKCRKCKTKLTYCGCGAPIHEPLEEKQVDTSFVADLISLAISRPKPDAIIALTSDRDIFPGVIAAKDLGASVFILNYSAQKHGEARALHPLIYPKEKLVNV